MRITQHLPVVLLFLSQVAGWGENWPNWRGPSGDGSTPENRFPVSWDNTNNVLWRVPLLEPGNPSPIVWKEWVFLTQAVGNRRTLMSVNRKDGAVLWQAGPNPGNRFHLQTARFVVYRKIV
jgi:outer membrane protein assembly factor BamB